MGIDTQARKSASDLAEKVNRLISLLKRKKAITKDDLEYIETGVYYKVKSQPKKKTYQTKIEDF